jgi:hypothetical protein
VKHLLSKFIKKLADSKIQKGKNVRYLTVFKSGISYRVDIGPGQMDHKQMSDLIYYAVKYLAEQLGISVQDAMFFLIAYFEHIETGKSLTDISDEYTSKYFSEMAKVEKIDA